MAERSHRALAGACLAIVCWGIGPLAIHAIAAPTALVAWWRMAIGAVVTTAIAARFARRPTRADLAAASGAGVLFATSLLTGWQSLRDTSIANAQLIPSLQPIVILLVAGRLFGERITRRAVAWGVLGVAGVVVFVLGSGNTGGASLRGDLWAVCNLTLWTGYFLEMKRLRTRGIDTLPLLASVMVVGTVALTPYVLVVERGLPVLQGWAWAGVLFVVFVPGVTGHGLTTYAQAHVEVSVLSLLGLGTPVISAAGAWVVYDQPLGAIQLTAGVVVLVALAGVVLERRSRSVGQTGQSLVVS